MYNNVKFTRLVDSKTKETYNDFGLFLSPFELESPEVQTDYADIVGRDGSVDLTEILGQINYKNRELNLVFTLSNGIKNTAQIYTEIANFLHGQKMKIILPSFEDYYLIGRCKIGSLDRAKKTSQINVTANCEPYKYKQELTNFTAEIEELPYKIIINNLKMPTIPIITTTNNVVMNFENTDYSWSEGEHLNTSIVLKEGLNEFTFKEGSEGTVAFSYQEGTLWDML